MAPLYAITPLKVVGQLRFPLSVSEDSIGSHSKSRSENVFHLRTKRSSEGGPSAALAAGGC